VNKLSIAMVALLAAAGCKDDEHYPPGEGGGSGGGGGSGRIDGGGGASDGGIDGGGPSDAGDGGTLLAGQLCNVVDMRVPLECPGGDLDPIDVVELGSGTEATTDRDGTFSMPIPFDNGLALAVGLEDGDTRDSLLRAGQWDGGMVRAPRVAEDDWQAFLAFIDGLEMPGTASIAVYVRDDDGPVAGAVVAVAGSKAIPFYDTDTGQQWSAAAGATGPFGAALLLSIPAAASNDIADITVTVGGDDFDLSVPIAADQLTWARITVP